MQLTHVQTCDVLLEQVMIKTAKLSPSMLCVRGRHGCTIIGKPSLPLFQAGGTIVSNMETGIRQSRRMALLITPNFVNSLWVQFEAAMAKTKEADTSKVVRILRLLLWHYLSHDLGIT